MKKITLAAQCLAAGTAIAIGAYQLGARHNSMAPQGALPTAVPPPDARLDPKTGRPVLYWHDPMVPGKRFDKPGKSPFMDMQLVPVYADESAGSGVKVSPGLAQNLGIRTATVRKADLTAIVEAVGVVGQNERATEVVQSRVTGYIEKLHVRAVLDPVKKGQTLATVFAPDWAAALEEYLGVRRAQAGPALIEAARARLRLLSIPEDVIAIAEQSGTVQTRFTLTAPTSGVVTELGVRDGAMVAPGMTLFRIVDLSSVWVTADVPASLAGQVRLGSEAEVRVAGLDTAIQGKLSAILPDVDPATRTLKARIELRNPGLLLKPGMFARVTFNQAATGLALVIPQEAVIATGRRHVVIVAADGGRYSTVEVQIGRESGADVEVKSGLSEGQQVVASGQFLLDSEANLKSGLTRMDAGSAQAAAPATYTGEGKVEAIDKDGVIISHGPIPSLKWGPMTMGFKKPGKGLPRDLRAGSRIRFEFVQQGNDYVLQNVTPMPVELKP